MNTWTRRRLDELCRVTRGASPRPIIEWIAPEGIPWIKISDASAANSRTITQTAEFIKPDGARHSVRVLPGDLIVSNSATPGIPKFVGMNACIHDGWLLLRDFHGVIAEFLYYRVVLDRVALIQQGNGSVFTNLKTDILKSHIIDVPPISEQRAISATLGALDDKIESNRRACDLLWSLTGASWEKLTGEASVRPLGEVLELVYGKSLPAVKRTHGSVPVYGSNGITGWHNVSLVAGPVVVVGRKGSIGEVHWSHVSAFPIDTTFYVRSRDNYPLVACYLALRKAGLQSMNSDSAIPGLNRDRALRVKVTLPVLREATVWARNANLLVTQIAAIEEQTVTLETLRNDLLPELLSGRLRVAITTEVPV